MKVICKIGLVAALLFLGFSEVSAQSKTITFTGSGRLAVNNASLDADYHNDLAIDGDTIPGDTTTARRQMGGYTVFDLGFMIRPNATTEIKAVTRVQSDLDGFWGAGINFSLFQLYAQGVIGGSVKYQVGDIKAKLTPYTLFNSDDDLGGRHVPAFRLFRDVINYDSFYQDNTWRQQGIQTEFALISPVLIDEISFQGMISRNRQTDFFFAPDRLFGLAQIGLAKYDMVQVHYNYAHLFDVARTAQFAENHAHSLVHSFDWRTDPNLMKGISFTGEAGWSKVYYEETAAAPEDTTNYFLDASLEYTPENKPYTISVGWRSVASGFRSAGAQGKRINYETTPTTFSFMTNQEVLRPIAIPDLMSDRTLYNRSFSATLGSYNPMYNNVDPYGQATPNRQGLSIGYTYENDSALIAEVDLDVQYLFEISGRGIEEKRNFSLARFYVDLSLDHALQWKRPQHFIITGGWQNTQRDGLSGFGEGLDGIGAVDLSSLYFEAGLSNELFDQFDLLTGLVYFGSNGNEYMAVRNEFNEITDYTDVQADLKESMIVAGFRYRFTNNSHLVVQQQFTKRDDNLSLSTNWTMNQFTVLYNMFF